jgi:hypothetical protein
VPVVVSSGAMQYFRSGEAVEAAGFDAAGLLAWLVLVAANAGALDRTKAARRM